MIHHESPSFDDLEPEGEDARMYADLEDGEGEMTAFDGHEMDGLFADDMLYFDVDEDGACGLPRQQEVDEVGQRRPARPALRKASQTRHRPRGDSLRHLTFAIASEDDADEDGGETLLDMSEALDPIDPLSVSPPRWLEEQELMETLASAAAASRDCVTAVGLTSALAPLALRTAPNAYGILRPALTPLIKGVVRVTRQLHGAPATRRHLRAMPVILQRTVLQLAYSALCGQPIDPHRVSKVLTRQTEQVLRSQPRRSARRGARSQSGF